MQSNLKRCKTCHQDKSIDSFELMKNRHRGRTYRRNTCKECRRARHNELFTSEYYLKWYFDNHDKCIESMRESRDTYRKNHNGDHPSRPSELRSNYDITTDEYEQLLAEQYHVCAICKKACKSGKHLAVDHCHKTGRIRGLLCRRCNQMLGAMEDSPELLRRAADYLEE